MSTTDVVWEVRYRGIHFCPWCEKEDRDMLEVFEDGDDEYGTCICNDCFVKEFVTRRRSSC